MRFFKNAFYLLLQLLWSMLFLSCEPNQKTKSIIPTQQLDSKDSLVDADFQWEKLKIVFNEFYKNKYPKNPSQVINVIEKQTLINVQYWGFDNKIHKGQLVCNHVVADELKSIFNELLAIKFPIYSVIPISEFQFTDALSMQANNTTCFDYRLKIMGNGMSKHATGMAIDLNPMQNPYIHKSKTEPFPNQSELAIGRIRNTSENEKKVIEIFKKYGWKWGGNWRSAKDYMHFEK